MANRYPHPLAKALGPMSPLDPLSDPDAMSQMFKFISRPPLPREHVMSPTSALTSFALYQWSNPHTTAVYPFLAVSTDESALLSFGDHDIGFDLAIASDAAHWLEHDFKRTGEGLLVELSTVRYLLDATFVGGAEFGLLSFNEQLGPSRLQLSLCRQAEADDGPEYVIQRLGRYQRLCRETDTVGLVAPAERAVLDVCIATFTELAARCARLVLEPPPPRYRSGTKKSPN